jgi:HEAT repeat protein
MNLFTIVRYAAAILTFLSAALLILIIGVKLLTSNRLRKNSAFRARAQGVLKQFLSSEVSLERASDILSKNPKEALLLLMETCNSVAQEDRKKLLPLLTLLPFRKQQLSAINSRSCETRLHAAEALGYIGDDSVVPSLMIALRDEILAVRLAAATSLVRLDCDVAMPILESLNIPGTLSQGRIAEVIASIGDRAVNPIIKILDHPSGNTTAICIATRASGILKAGPSLPFLANLLTHENREVRINCVRALASIGNHASAEPLAKITEDPSWEVRSAVMHAFGKLGADNHIPELLEGLSDPEWWVRYNSAKSLYQLGSNGIKALQNAAINHVDAYARDMSRQILQQHGLSQVTTEVHA